MKRSVGVIGRGFVGGSLTQVLEERGITVFSYDLAKKVINHGVMCDFANSIQQFVEHCESSDNTSFTQIYFVCVPTPMNEDGSCDTSIVAQVIGDLCSAHLSDGKQRIAVIKSTIPPGTTEKFNETLPQTQRFRVIHNPEFLREATALDDMRNQDRIVLGGPRPYINTVKQFYESVFPNVSIIKTSSTTSEMVKYFTNVHLAARVVLSCEISQICKALDEQGMNIDYDKVCEYSRYDKRLGGSHMTVPGVDGIPGARGHCFPKDLNALSALAKQVGVTPIVMDAVWQKNLELVPKEHRDWEKMIGRAVSKKV